MYLISYGMYFNTNQKIYKKKKKHKKGTRIKINIYYNKKKKYLQFQC